MRHLLLSAVLLFVALTTAVAQERNISGTLLDKTSREPVLAATVQLLRSADSTYVTGATTDDNGLFKVKAPENGKYIVKISNIGYKTITRNVTIAEDKDFAFGKINMQTDAVMLKEVVAHGVAAKVVLKEDTFIYNAAAYRTPEGSVVEELVKRLPGAQVDDDGNITINGKTVSKVMVDGKEFMTGDTKTAIKNLPTAIVDKVKAYQEKSDLAKMTGVDDGEEETVLDFAIKEGMNKGAMVNIDLGGGTKSRYAERIFSMYTKDNSRLMLLANLNNVGDRGFTSGGRGGGGGGNGLNSSKMIGMNYNYEIKDKIKVDLSGRWNHTDGNVWNSSATESFVSTSAAFSNSLSQSYSRGNTWNATTRVEWQPDTLTRFMLRANYSNSKSDSRSTSSEASFNDDPYATDEDFDLSNLADSLDSTDPLRRIIVNTRRNSSLSYSSSNTFNVNATFSRRLSSNGRNITLQGRYSYSDSESESLSTQYVHLYQLATGDSSYYRNRYNVTPSDNKSYQISATYSEPIAKATFLQLRYMYRNQVRTSDRQTYDFSDYSYFGYGVDNVYRDFASYLNPFLTDTYTLDDYLDTDQSRYTKYNNNIHEIELSLKRTTNKYNLNIGVMLQPQNSKLTYKHLGLDTITRRTVTNFSPTMDFRYRWSKQKSLRLNYRSSTDQPSMTDLLPITDDTDPLNISKGNPDLKPSFTNSLMLQYNNYVQKRKSTVMAHVRYQNTSNSVSSMVTYDETTGGKTTQPMNINGNWSVNSTVMWNTPLDSLGIWSINTVSGVNYNNRASYVNLNQTAEAQKSYTRTTELSERLGISWRQDWIEVELNGNATYSKSKNKIQTSANLETWNFGYGTDITFSTPWNMSLSTGAHMSSRRGYSSSAANTNEFIWNAQLAQSFLKGKPLTISIQFNDLLHQRSSFSRAISASQRTDSYYNGVNSYAMVHVIYRFNTMGGKAGRRGGDGDGGRDGERPGGRDGGMGGPGGGPGGGMGGPGGGMGGGGPRM